MGLMGKGLVGKSTGQIFLPEGYLGYSLMNTNHGLNCTTDVRPLIMSIQRLSCARELHHSEGFQVPLKCPFFPIGERSKIVT